jgi:hypothetical protein
MKNFALKPRKSIEQGSLIAEHVMPHEGDVRAWFARARVSPEDIDDLIQEAYCKLTALDRYKTANAMSGCACRDRQLECSVFVLAK